MIIPLHCIFLFVSLACCASSQAPCPNLCTTQPLNIESASSTNNYILYGQPTGYPVPGSSRQVIIQEQQNAQDILWIATFHARTNSYTFAYQSNPSYRLSYQVESGLAVPIMLWDPVPIPPPTNNLKWILESADSCNTYAMKNMESGTYLQFNPGDTNVVVLAPSTGNSDQPWIFPGPSC